MKRIISAIITLLMIPVFALAASQDFKGTINGNTITAGTGTVTMTAGKTITVEDNSLVNQDLTSDASPTFATVKATDATITAAGTPVKAGQVNRLVYEVVRTYLNFAGGGTVDSALCTLPAKTRVLSVIADTTILYTGGSASAVSLLAGAAGGGQHLIAVHDVKTAAVTKGLADADLGTGMTRAAAIQGGWMPSWTGTTVINARISVTGDTASNLTQGSTTFYIVTERF